MGGLGAAVFAGGCMALLFYALGAVERHRWGGTAPTIREYMYEGKRDHRSSILQLQAATWGRKLLMVGIVAMVVGAGLLIVAAL